MSVTIRAATSPGELRVAVVRDAVLAEYALWRPGAPDGVGDLYRGRIIARVPAMAGAFVALVGADGFLPDTEGAADLTEGAMLGVRVTRAAQGGKGPRLTARLTDAEQASIGSGPPALLQRGPDPLRELAAAYPGAPVLVDDAALAASLRPTLGARLEVVREAFDAELEARIDALADTVVDLPGGARLSIHPTPALTAIDIDAGSATAVRAGKARAQHALNRALLPALAAEIRLRNLSGAILVDFAGLPARKRDLLAPDLAAALADDPMRPRLLGFTRLGLAEIVRSRVHPPLHELLVGPHAAGMAALRAALAAVVAIRVVAAPVVAAPVVAAPVVAAPVVAAPVVAAPVVAAPVVAAPGRAPALRAAPQVVAALEGDPVALADFARRAGQGVMLRADPSLPATGWRLDPP